MPPDTAAHVAPRIDLAPLQAGLVCQRLPARVIRGNGRLRQIQRDAIPTLIARSRAGEAPTR